MQDRVGLEAPGLSLFQGSDSIQINAGLHRQEEEEEQEDQKRRHGEINELLTVAFDDLEPEDDASSLNSSHFHEASRDMDHSGTVNCAVEPIINDKGPSYSQYQNDFGMYASDGTANYTRSTLCTHESDSTKGPTTSDTDRAFGAYNQFATPLNNNQENISANSITEGPYELPRPPSLTNPSSFPHNLKPEINDGYTLLDTPSNHYDATHSKNYPNNGYIGSYESNTPHQNLKKIGDTNEGNSEHYNHCYKTSPNGRPINDMDAYKATNYNSKEQLEVLYSVRKREIQQLLGDLRQMKEEKETIQNELSRKLYWAQAEIDKSNLLKIESQGALVQAKTEILELQSQMQCYKEKIDIMEKTNKNIADELTKARESVVDLQQKIEILERVQSLQANDKTHEKFLKQAQEKHSIEVKNMQKQVDILTEKLAEKESAYVTLEFKLIEIRRAHENLIVEKGDAINRLAQALTESQEQCQNLMTANNTQEMMQLQNRVKVLSEEKEELLTKLQELQKKLNVKTDTIQYDSLLATTLEDDSDSIKQMKLGEFYNKPRCIMGEETANKLREELQRCMSGQAIKRKEIMRLEETVAQKEKELNKATKIAEASQRDAAQYAKRVSDLEHQLQSFITEHSLKTNTEIQRLSDHLTNINEQKEVLVREKQELEQQLELTLANQEETIRKIHQETLAHQENAIIDEYNKEYLEIHEKAVERVRQEAQVEIVQLKVQLEQTQKELDRVKEMYIDVCSSKEELINDHKNEIRILKETYINLEAQKHDVDQMRMELDLQKKISNKLSHECESHMKRVVELEKDLSTERKKRTDYTKKVHAEIAQAKEQALTEIRNACPERQINIPLTDYCSEHSDKIIQLEDDCKRLEEKLSIAVEEQRKMADLQTELDNANIKMAQMEIALASLKKKYDSVARERNDFISKLAKQESIIVNMKKNCEIQATDEANLSAKIKLNNESLKSKCETLLKDKIEYRTKISELEMQLSDCNKKIAIHLENNPTTVNENLSTTRDDLEKELYRYKELVKQLTEQLNSSKDCRKSEYLQEEKLKQLELELAEKEAQLQRLKDLEKIKDERDQLVTKLKNHAKQFEEYVKNQKQVSTELNLSPQNTTECVDVQKIRELSRIEVRDEMEQKLAKEIRIIEEQHREKEKYIEENYKSMIRDLNLQYIEKTKELQASFKTQEQIVTHMIETKLSEYRQELLARKLKIETLEMQLKQKERDVEEKKNVMAQAMSKWAAEMQDMEANQVTMQKQIMEFREAEEAFKKEILVLKDRINTIKHKYQTAKKTSQNYKDLAEKKEKYLMGECRRIIEGYNKVMSQVQQNFDDIVSNQEKEVDEKLKEFQSQYDAKLHQVQLQMKYKDKY